jgi:hypothetical protein
MGLGFDTQNLPAPKQAKVERTLYEGQSLSCSVRVDERQYISFQADLEPYVHHFEVGTIDQAKKRLGVAPQVEVEVRAKEPFLSGDCIPSPF